MQHSTIAAIATAPGAGGIAVVRLSGPESYAVAEQVFRPQNPAKQVRAARGYTALFGSFVEGGESFDQGVALFFRAPHSYTGEDVVELSCHGGTAVARRLVESCIAAGAAPAAPGEYTRRAFLNGKLSLTQAEAVADLISAQGRQGAALANAALEGALAAFRGEITQIPPMYSALKRDGKKLYELARAGKEVERAPRPVTIHALEVVEQTGPNCYTLRVRCSKGTYVRTLCHDIGAALGCGGCMSALRRTEAAGFSLAEAVPLEALLDAPDPAALLRPVDAYFFRYPAMTVEGTALRKAKNGNPFPCSAADGDWRVYGPGGEFLLLGRCAGGMMSTIKSFFEV